MKIYKATPSWQWERLCSWPPSIKPHNMTWESGNLTYDFIPGCHPTDGREMHKFGARALWGHGVINGLEINRQEYVEYVVDRMNDVIDDASLRLQAERVLNFIHVANLTPVADYHGDFTNQNVIISAITGKMMTFDPGHARGLPCRELDEAKMLQSADGFCETYRKIPRLRWDIFPSKIHYTLLLSHYIRMLHHVTHTEAVRFAQSRIVGIVNLLK